MPIEIGETLRQSLSAVDRATRYEDKVHALLSVSGSSIPINISKAEFDKNKDKAIAKTRGMVGEERLKELISKDFNEVENVINSVPQYLRGDFQSISYRNFPGEFVGINGYVTEENNNIANVDSYGSHPKKTAIHELEHTRQFKYGLNMTKEENKLYYELKDRMSKNSHLFASNSLDDSMEVFANLAVAKNEAFSAGKSLKESSIGKALGLDKNPELAKFVDRNTFLGVPALSEGNVGSTPSKKVDVRESIKNFLNNPNPVINIGDTLKKFMGISE